ncbi:hypothetical protein P171DRAFT_522969 [Karstenula rhodostoma CBS 690.94]|uniref:Restriction of telomere capping protein 4 n=1 Tax=Karstenula rhodostoma CBS 690.94 TaxID=1392251 RepID=A0A9P4PDW8_9PLEO|nr:hypothetical protein P171DRAFT_522969 [Karstenula rhodostoma CBS 690.94]
MPILSRRNAPKLLRSVNNRPHASEADHEDAPRKANLQQTHKPPVKTDADIDIHADPISSSDENEVPPPSMSQDSSTSTRGGARNGRGASRSGAQGEGKAMRVPPRGAFGAGLKHKESFEEEKENSRGAASSASGKRETVEAVYFGMGDTPRKKQKTRNVHAAPIGFNRKAFGKDKPSNTLSIPKSRDVKHIDDLDNALSTMLDGHERYVEFSDDEPSPPAKKRAPTIPQLPQGYVTSSIPTTKDSQTSAPSPPSSPLTPVSFHFDDDIHASENDIAHSPKPDPNSTCALCQESVEAPEQRDFWAAHPTRTVRDQMLFCKAHKRSKAQREYTARGYPSIDWTRLPSRIRGFRTELVSILRNETAEESVYRKKHAGRLGSGKAAALPAKRRGRKAQPQAVEQGMEDRIDAASSSAGYYGPRGKRVMMEVTTSELSDEIRDVAAKDPVVGRSGFAMFLQAVLVPECAVLLVMEDMGLVRGEAREVLEVSGEMGELVNEEIDDEVVESEEDEEEEYEDY